MDHPKFNLARVGAIIFWTRFTKSHFKESYHHQFQSSGLSAFEFWHVSTLEKFFWSKSDWCLFVYNSSPSLIHSRLTNDARPPSSPIISRFLKFKSPDLPISESRFSRGRESREYRDLPDLETLLLPPVGWHNSVCPANWQQVLIQWLEHFYGPTFDHQLAIWPPRAWEPQTIWHRAIIQ